MDYKTEIIQLNKLELFDFRDLRQDLIEKLTERISKNGYNPARPLTVILMDGKYIVADGNHRLTTAKNLKIKELPCIIYNNESDPYLLATNGNQDENTYAPMDLFDYLHVIKNLKEKGNTHKEIGKKINQSESWVKNYSSLLNNIVTENLEFVKSYQEGRVSEKVTNVTYNFNENWFRTSGLYELQEKYQSQCLKEFINDKCNWNKEKLQRETQKYKKWQDYLKIAENKLVDSKNIEIIKELIENNIFKSEDQLLDKIRALNQESQNKLICGDALEELLLLNDSSIDVVITDPPYGEDYTSNHSKYKEYISKKEIKNDSLTEALNLIEDSCKILINKTKKDAHLYFFVSWKNYHLFREIIIKYFVIKNLIVWDKENHSMGDLENTWGNRYEFIIFASKGDRKLNIRKPDIIRVPRISTVNSLHQTEKPVKLMLELLEVSGQAGDTIIDPFMGSGSTIEAIKKFRSDINYIGIEIDSELFEKAKNRINEL